MAKKRIGIAIDLDWPIAHHQGVASGALRYGRERGWTCEVDPYIGAPGTRSGPFDGVLGRVGPDLAAWAARTRTPLVNVWVNSPCRKAPLVMIDFPAAGALAAAHFRGRGLRRFGFVGQERNAAAELLLQGFREAVQADGFDVDVLRVGADPQDGAGWMRIQRPLGRWTRSLRPPVGVLTSSDILARYLCAHGTTAGLRIPDDLAVVGSGNTMLLCELLDPAISSLDHGFERVGRRAAELLEALMAGRTLPPSPVRVPPSGLVPRRSSDVFAVEDAGVAAALRAIWASSHRPTKVAGVLAAVPTSRRTLERRFRELLGRTVHDEIRRAHVEQAKRLLVETAEPLKAVATRSGFRDPQQFSRVFRASEGLTPGEYRRIHAG